MWVLYYIYIYVYIYNNKIVTAFPYVNVYVSSKYIVRYVYAMIWISIRCNSV